jgi:hypothetical protein
LLAFCNDPGGTRNTRMSVTISVRQLATLVNAMASHLTVDHAKLRELLLRNPSVDELAKLFSADTPPPTTVEVRASNGTVTIEIPNRKRRIPLQEENAQFVRTRSRRYRLARQAGCDEALCYEIASGNDAIELAEADERSAKQQRR